ncbi:MAG: DUF4349 domain-containing protein, partial [Saprospiraceae bacterium]
MKKLLQFLTLLSLIMAFACSNAKQDNGSALSLMETEMDQSGNERSRQDPPPPPQPEEESQNSSEPVERKIIKEGSITFETDDLLATRQLILTAVAESGGYLAQDNAYNEYDRIQHQLVLRIPAGKFDTLLNKISASAKKLDSKNISAQDVTE